MVPGRFQAMLPIQRSIPRSSLLVPFHTQSSKLTAYYPGICLGRENASKLKEALDNIPTEKYMMNGLVDLGSFNL